MYQNKPFTDINKVESTFWRINQKNGSNKENVALPKRAWKVLNLQIF